jgi:hypothetical protein
MIKKACVVVMFALAANIAMWVVAALKPDTDTAYLFWTRVLTLVTVVDSACAGLGVFFPSEASNYLLTLYFLPVAVGFVVISFAICADEPEEGTTYVSLEWLF